ncbi:MAG: AbrB/MazE/SpoVT family DNA-binding domain-containing protein [Pirellulales bacterium]
MDQVGDEGASYRAKVDPSGRIVIPAELRVRLGIAEGDELIVASDGAQVVVKTPDQALREVQTYFAGLVPPGVSLVDELLRERREDAARE